MNVLGVLEKTRRSSLYWKEIMNTLMGLLLLLAAGFRAVRPGAIEVTNDTRNYDVLWETNVTEENSAEEKLRELRIEMVKLQILARLNLKEPLPSVQPPSESARETIRLLLGETGEQQRQPQNDPLDRKERLVIHAKSDAIQCLQTSDSNCRLFQYELSTTLNASSMCLWLYKTEDSVSKALSVLVSYSNSEEEKSYDQIVTETRQVGWNKLELPSISLPASWNETFVCSIEIKGNFECLRSTVPSCRRFEFDIPTDTEDSKPEFWIHKINSSEFDELTISTSYFFPGNENELTMENTQIPEDDDQHKWVSLHFPDLEELINLQSNLTYVVEVTGMIIREDEHNMPFLKMTQHVDRRHRKRRSENSEKVETCNPIPFTVSFDDIGFGDWIEYPKTYEANLCSGYCLRAPNHYETILDIVFQRNSTLEQEFGRCWSTCCRPKEYNTLRLIYREKDNTIVDRQMINMIVTACSCS